MRYRVMEEKDVPAIVALWNQECEKLKYKPYSIDEFRMEVVKAPGFLSEGCILAYDEAGVLAGFVNAMVVEEFLPGQTKENTPGYIHLLLVDSKYRNCGIGGELLYRGECYLKQRGKKEGFFSHKCPVKMSWYVDELGHEHNKAPGIKAGLLKYHHKGTRGNENCSQQCFRRKWLMKKEEGQYKRNHNA